MPSPSRKPVDKNKPASAARPTSTSKPARARKSSSDSKLVGNVSKPETAPTEVAPSTKLTAKRSANSSKGTKRSRTAKEGSAPVPKKAGVVVKKSPLGKALFSKIGFAAEEQVGLVTGKLIQDAEYGSEYCIAVSDQASLEPAAPFRYLNHSCEPNCQLMTWEDEESKELRLGVFALTEIKPGIELTIDYAWSADAAIRCLCGKSNCRGWVVAESELAIVKRRNRKKKSVATPQSSSI